VHQTEPGHGSGSQRGCKRPRNRGQNDDTTQSETPGDRPDQGDSTGGYGATVCSTVTGGRQANGLQPVATQQTATSDGVRSTVGRTLQGPRALQVRQRAGGFAGGTGYSPASSEALPWVGPTARAETSAGPLCLKPLTHSKGPLDSHATSIIAIHGPAIEMEKGSVSEAVG
jgi:hypothetical protein